jgi:hypothetical protein
MPIEIAFECSDADLEHFRNAMREAQGRARRLDEKEIVAAAKRLVGETARRMRHGGSLFSMSDQSIEIPRR